MEIASDVGVEGLVVGGPLWGDDLGGGDTLNLDRAIHAMCIAGRRDDWWYPCGVEIGSKLLGYCLNDVGAKRLK